MKVLGVGGHAKVIIDAAELSDLKVSGVYDDDPKTHETMFCGLQVEGAITADLSGPAVIAIGNNEIRKNIDQRVLGCQWKTVIHPNAIIADDVEIGEGTVIMAGAVIQPGCKIGRHVIINTGACLDHDCEIADYVHIAPNCSLAGGVKLDEGTFAGIGSSIVQYVSIGKWSTLGAGSVVIHDIPPHCTAVGVPAKPIKFHR